MRRCRMVGGRNAGPVKRSLLGSHFNDASARVMRLCHDTVAAMVRVDSTAEDILTYMFPPEILDKLRAARPYTDNAHSSHLYPIMDSVLVKLDAVDNMLMPNGPTHGLQPFYNPAAARRFLEASVQVRNIFEDFALVRHVLEWMDEHATAGAMRYYWPAVMALAPECEAIAQQAPIRYAVPQGIASLLPAIRETSTILASAALLPARQAQDDIGIMIACTAQPFTRAGLRITPSFIYFNMTR